MNFSLAVRSGRKVRATFMAEEARMGIPNRAHRRRHGQEGQSRCKLAMPKLAIHVGHHRPVGWGGRPGDHGRVPALPIPGFPVTAGDRVPRKVREPDVKLPICSSVSYSYAQFLS